jgi:hypothetical protein
VCVRAHLAALLWVRPGSGVPPTADFEACSVCVRAHLAALSWVRPVSGVPPTADFEACRLEAGYELRFIL